MAPFFFSAVEEERWLQDKIAAEAAKVDGLQDQVTTIRAESAEIHKRLMDLPPIRDLDQVIAKTRLIHNQAMTDLKMIEASVESNEKVLRAMRDARNPADQKLLRLCGLVEAQDLRLRELHRRMAQTLFGIKGSRLMGDSGIVGGGLSASATISDSSASSTASSSSSSSSSSSPEEEAPSGGGSMKSFSSSGGDSQTLVDPSSGEDERLDDYGRPMSPSSSASGTTVGTTSLKDQVQMHGSGSFMLKEELSFRSRQHDEVGILDSKWAIGTIRLDCQWLHTQIMHVQEHINRLETDIQSCRDELDRTSTEVKFRQRFLDWIGGVEQLMVLEEAHHRIRMELIAIGVRKDIVKPENEFAAEAMKLFDYCTARLRDITQRVYEIHDEHTAWREAQIE